MNRYLYPILILVSLFFFIPIQATEPHEQTETLVQDDSCFSIFGRNDLFELFEEKERLKQQILLIMSQDSHISISEIAERVRLEIERTNDIIRTLESEARLRRQVGWDSLTWVVLWEPTVEVIPEYPGVVKLFSLNGGMTTGFFIQPRILVTAAQLTYDKNKRTRKQVYLRDTSTGRLIFTQVLEVDRGNDIVLLETFSYESKHFYSVDSSKASIESLNKSFNQEAQAIPSQEESATAVISGFGEGFPYLVQGLSVDYNNNLLTAKFINTFHGMSGSPVFFKGNLIGVIINDKAVFSFTGDYIKFIPIHKLSNWIKLKKERVQRATFLWPPIN